MTGTVAIVSGGMDSVTMAYLLHRQGHTLHLLSFDYGQRHVRELDCAKVTAARLSAEHTVVDLTSITRLLKGSALTDPSIEVPEGHYEDESMKATVVPNRNMMMASIAGAVAVAEQRENIAMGIHAGDHAVYPDCRPEFARALGACLGEATEGFGYSEQGVEVLTPFVDITKADIAKLGDELGVLWADTWSCYQGGDYHCGRCGTCVERIEAMGLANVYDPTIYRDAEGARQIRTEALASRPDPT